MPEDEKETHIAKKIAILRDNENFENPRVSPEGYGSMLNNCDKVDSMIQQANTMAIEARNLKNKESISLLIKAFYIYLKANCLIKTSDVKTYLKVIKIIHKHLEFTLAQACNYDMPEHIEALEWAIFNVKAIKLMQELDLIPKCRDDPTYLYLIDMLKSIRLYYNKYNSNPIELVKLQDIEKIFREKLGNTPENKH